MIIPRLEHEVTTTYAMSVWPLKSLSVAPWSPQKFHSLLLQSQQEFLSQACLGSSLLYALRTTLPSHSLRKKSPLFLHMEQGKGEESKSPVVIFRECAQPMR